ncbi:transglutaminase-like cysteine peptidase [Legionella maioricensis]|uniref:Transglutaminase-like cysteine peptidase n=1 Tax=Legionella maioricensis TaxID=2896528 RepID=A0A9X2CZ68_9GAMM|nr:transglutaminase-like cysteine peptidase [Legionella maioricensis]MCL9683486.1 transglutaminase-like cysteine peptidase [Legionella maioricensis]MCL9686785.1 transglutaminase-like cysteine peptidase [Legionella maioricensis]
MEKKSHGDVQKRYRAWAKLLRTLKNKPVNVQLEKVNSFFNQFRYQTSEESRGIADYWKTPEEFINDGGGDCKDYVIIKYFTLINLGVPREKLRLTYVIYLTLKQAHMVLSYYSSPEAEPLILDNLENEILYASKRPDLKPVYSFNGEGLWLQKQRNQGTSIGQPNSLGKWDDLMKRMQLEGDKP